MKIIKKGSTKDNKIAHFTCKHCGCEFECSESEYWTDTSVSLTSYPPQYYVMASCPECYKVCRTTIHVPVDGHSITVTGSTVANKNYVELLDEFIKEKGK